MLWLVFAVLALLVIGILGYPLMRKSSEAPAPRIDFDVVVGNTPGFALPASAKALGWRPQAVALGSGPHRGRVRGVSYLGQTVEYLLETPAGPVKAEVPAAVPRHEAGAEIAFDLPLATAAVMERA